MLNFLLQNYYKIYKKEHDQSFKTYKKNSFYIIYIYIYDIQMKITRQTD